MISSMMPADHKITSITFELASENNVISIEVFWWSGI